MIIFANQFAFIHSTRLLLLVVFNYNELELISLHYIYNESCYIFQNRGVHPYCLMAVIMTTLLIHLEQFQCQWFQVSIMVKMMSNMISFK